MKTNKLFPIYFISTFLIWGCTSTKKTPQDKVIGAYSYRSDFYYLRLELDKSGSAVMYEGTDLLKYEIIGNWILKGDSILISCQQKIGSNNDRVKTLPFVSLLNDSVTTPCAFIWKNKKLVKIYPGDQDVLKKR